MWCPLVLLLLCSAFLPSASTDESSCPPCPPQDPGNRVRLAYLVNVHDDRTVLDAAKLIDAISHPNNVILVHVDKKLDPSVWQNSALHHTVTSCSCGTRSISSVASCEWGKWSMNDPVLWALDELTFNPAYEGGFDKFVTLSGDSYPTLAPNAIGSLFTAHPDLLAANIITSLWSETGMRPTRYNEFPKTWHKRKAYSFPANLAYKDPDLRVLEGGKTGEGMFDGAEVVAKRYVAIYFGSQWMSLSPSLVYFLGRSMRDEHSLARRLKAFYELKRKVVTDETFFPTVIMNTPAFAPTVPDAGRGEGFSDGLPWLKSARFERMDEHAPSCTGALPDKQRVVAMEGVEPRVWGPYFLGVYDLADIIESGALWFRKVSSVVEGNLYKVFPKDSREEVEALPRIAWDGDVEYEISERPVF